MKYVYSMTGRTSIPLHRLKDYVDALIPEPPDKIGEWELVCSNTVVYDQWFHVLWFWKKTPDVSSYR